MTARKLHSSRVPVSPKELPSGAGTRYARHFTLPGFGFTGQQRLYGAKVLSIGAVSYTHLTLPTNREV